MDADEALLRLEKELGKLESAFKAMNAERFESDFRNYSNACFTEIKTGIQNGTIETFAQFSEQLDAMKTHLEAHAPPGPASARQLVI
jgi:hypothetical protein